MRVEATLLLLVLSLGCAGDGAGTQTPSPSPSGQAPADDRSGPAIVAPLIADGQPRNQAVDIEASITDPSGVAFAALYFRAVGTDFWASAPLAQAGGDVYRGVIPAEWVGEGGVDWYIEARDGSFNRNTSYFPPTGPVVPLYFSTESGPRAFPFFESFEPEDEDSPRWLLGETGWTGHVLGFFDGQNWTVSDRQASDGRWSAAHLHGSPYQVEPFEDWLVSPPIDLSEATTVDLYWRELLDHPEYADHKLLVSTTSSDPVEGSFEEVLTPLEPSDGVGWPIARHVDLSAFAGEPQVFVAFVYEGLWADDWYIDEVRLDVHGPDLRLQAASFAPEGVRPGEAATLSFAVRNEGLASSGPLTVQVLSEDGDVLVTPATQQLQAVAPGERLDVASVVVTVGKGHENHVWVPFTVRLSDGERTFDEQVRLKVGRPPVAFVQIAHTYENDIQLFIGYDDGDARPFYQLVQQDGGTDGAGIFTWEIDLDAQAAAFPPNIEHQRWFVEVWDDSVGNVGVLDTFYLAQGEDVYVAEGLPRAIPDDGTKILQYVPGRAELQLAELNQSPAQVAPGDAVSLGLSVYNVSAPPRGALTGSLRTTEPHVLGLDAASIPFSYSAITGDGDISGLAVGASPFLFSVSPEHLSSDPLEFTLILTDGVDTWSLPLTVRVPYPVLGPASVIVADDEVEGAFEDYGLTPTETTALRILALNRGALPTFGAVTATLEVLDDGGTGFRLLNTEPVQLIPEPGEGAGAALIAGGRGKSGLVPVELDFTDDEDATVRLRVTLSDGVVSRSDEVVLPMLAPARNPLLSRDDDLGDAGGYGFDIVGGTWQRRGDFVQMRWTSDGALGLDQLLLYSYISFDRTYRYAMAWAFGEPVFFRWVTVSGGGYWSRSALPPSNFFVQPIDSRTVEFIIDLNQIGMSGRDLFGGASAGSCGALFCDDAPESAAASGGLVPFSW